MNDDLPNPLNKMDDYTSSGSPQGGGQQTYQSPYQGGQSMQQNQNQGQFVPGSVPPVGGFGQTQMQPQSQYQNQQGMMQQRPQVEPPNLGPDPHMVNKVEQLFIFIYVFIAALLLFRFVLSLFGASYETTFVSFVYDLTSPFMVPFEGMFGAPPGIGVYRVEFEVIVALIVYALLFFGLARLVRIIFR